MENRMKALALKTLWVKLLAVAAVLAVIAACGGNIGDSGNSSNSGGSGNLAGGNDAGSQSAGESPSESASAAPEELVELRMNVVSTGTQSLPAFVIQKLGLDEKHGFKMIAVPDSGAVNANWTAFKTGQVDGMISDWVSLARNVNQGDKAVAVVPFLGWGNGVLVPESSAVASLEDLKGLNIGVYNRLAPDWLFIRAAAKELYGFDPEKENTVSESAPGLLLGLMQEGKLEAGLNYGDLNNILLGTGGYRIPFGIKETMTELGLSTNAPFLYYTFSEEFMDAHPEVIRGFAAAYKEAIEFLNSDEDIWREIAENLKIDNEETIELMKENARSNIFTEATSDMEDNIQAIFEVMLQEAGERQLGIGSLPEGMFRQP